MKRRFLQFSLRGLLGLAVLVCLALGGWRLLDAYGNRFDVEARIGSPMVVRARYVSLFGPRECLFEYGYEAADGSWLADGVMRHTKAERAKRSWLCLYAIEGEFQLFKSPFRKSPSRLLLFVRPWNKPWPIREKIVDVK